MTQKINPYLLYEDAAAALDFLARAFGFEETMRMPRQDGSVGHAEMKLGDGRIMLGQPEREYRNPKRLGGATGCQIVWVWCGFQSNLLAIDGDIRLEQGRTAIPAAFR